MSHRVYMWIIFPRSLLSTRKMYVARRKVGMWLGYERIAKWLVYRGGGGRAARKMAAEAMLVHCEKEV